MTLKEEAKKLVDNYFKYYVCDKRIEELLCPLKQLIESNVEIDQEQLKESIKKTLGTIWETISPDQDGLSKWLYSDHFFLCFRLAALIEPLHPQQLVMPTWVEKEDTYGNRFSDLYLHQFFFDQKGDFIFLEGLFEAFSLRLSALEKDCFQYLNCQGEQQSLTSIEKKRIACHISESSDYFEMAKDYLLKAKGAAKKIEDLINALIKGDVKHKGKELDAGEPANLGLVEFFEWYEKELDENLKKEINQLKDEDGKKFEEIINILTKQGDTQGEGLRYCLQTIGRNLQAIIDNNREFFSQLNSEKFAKQQLQKLKNIYVSIERYLKETEASLEIILFQDDLERFAEYLKKFGDFDAIVKTEKYQLLIKVIDYGAINIFNEYFLKDESLLIYENEKDQKVPYYHAAYKGKADIIFSIIKQYPNLLNKVTSSQAKSILEIVISSDYTRLIELLLDLPNIDVARKNKMNALHFAAKEGNIYAAKIILEKNPGLINSQPINEIKLYGSFPIFFTLSGSTPLHMAISEEKIGMVEFLLQQPDINLSKEEEADDLGTPLQFAIKKNNRTIVELFFDKEEKLIEEKIPGGLKPLHEAAKIGSDQIVSLILEKKPTVVNEQKPDGWTALHLAAFNGHRSCVEVLLQRDETDLWLLNSENQTALELALNNHHVEISKKIFSKNPLDSLKFVDHTLIRKLQKVCGKDFVKNQCREALEKLSIREILKFFKDAICFFRSANTPFLFSIKLESDLLKEIKEIVLKKIEDEPEKSKLKELNNDIKNLLGFHNDFIKRKFGTDFFSTKSLNHFLLQKEQKKTSRRKEVSNP